MHNLLQKQISTLQKVFIPTITLGMFLFYLLWSAPASLILQEYTIRNWFITDNPLTPIITAVLFGITLLLFLFYKLNIKFCFHLLVGIILFAVLLSFFYNHIFPYSYGRFTDNNTLTPEHSLLGFSQWYYVLDFILILLAFFIVVLAIKKQKVTTILLFLSLFYGVKNIETIYKTKKSIDSTKGQHANSSYTLSTNKKNVLVFIYDGFDPRVVHYFLTNNSIPEQDTSWSKDFTFYNNVTSLSFLTIAATPPMFEGYSKAPQYNLQDIIQTRNYNHRKFLQDPADRLQKTLESNNIITKMSDNELKVHLPILAVFVYQSIPYITRHLIANEYSWKKSSINYWTILYAGALNETTFTVRETEYASFNLFRVWESHAPWPSPNSPYTYEEGRTNAQIMEQIRLHNTQDIFKIITGTIEHLKANGIYDNTKIILASDHGTHRGVGAVEEFMVKISQSPPTQPTRAFTALPSLLTIKDFNTTQNKMIVDNRFLSLADLPSIYKNSLDLPSSEPDYTKITPPQRVFNTIASDFYGYLSDQGVNELISNNSVPFIAISNISPFRATEYSVSLQEATNKTPYEIIK